MRCGWCRFRSSAADSGFIPEQFAVRPPPVPWRPIALGAFLFACGLLSLFLLATDTLEYLTSREGDIVAKLRGTEGVFGDKIDEKETDQEVRHGPCYVM